MAECICLTIMLTCRTWMIVHDAAVAALDRAFQGSWEETAFVIDGSRHVISNGKITGDFVAENGKFSVREDGTLRPIGEYMFHFVDGRWQLGIACIPRGHWQWHFFAFVDDALYLADYPIKFHQTQDGKRLLIALGFIYEYRDSRPSGWVWSEE